MSGEDAAWLRCSGFRNGPSAVLLAAAVVGTLNPRGLFMGFQIFEHQASITCFSLCSGQLDTGFLVLPEWTFGKVLVFIQHVMQHLFFTKRIVEASGHLGHPMPSSDGLKAVS